MANSENKMKSFEANIKRGRDFEEKETREWLDIPDGEAGFEVHTEWKGKKGRIDIRVEELGDFVSVIELKATDWDRILPHRIRVTALRHARQLWRYVEKELESELDVCPGVIYQKQPASQELQQRVEDILNEKMIQVVWRD